MRIDRGFCTVNGGRWLREGLHRHNPVHGAEQICPPYGEGLRHAAPRELESPRTATAQITES